MRHRKNAAALVAAGLLFTAVCRDAQAQQLPAHCTAEEKTGSIAEGSYRTLETAMNEMSKGEFAAAERRLVGLTERAQGYERAVVFQTLGFVHAQQERLKQALEAFEEALATNALPRQPREELTYNVGQLYIADEQYDRGIAALERYLETACKPPPAAAHMMLANAYAQAKKYEQSLRQVAVATEKAGRAEESWLQLKLALHYELKQLDECAKTLVDLIAMTNESGEYWKQLSGILLEIEEQEEALAVLAVAERQGLLDTERDLMNLASVYSLLEIPYKAGRTLERGLENGTIERTAKSYQLLSDAWIAAREWDKAEAALRRAAELSADGNLWMRLAQVLMEKESWRAAQDALQSALKAGVSDVGQANYLLGVAAYQAGDDARAVEALRAATRDPASQRQAQQWLDHIAANR